MKNLTTLELEALNFEAYVTDQTHTLLGKAMDEAIIRNEHTRRVRGSRRDDNVLLVQYHGLGYGRIGDRTYLTRVTERSADCVS